MPIFDCLQVYLYHLSYVRILESTRNILQTYKMIGDFKKTRMDTPDSEIVINDKEKSCRFEDQELTGKVAGVLF